jgi:hypothetical protein
MKSIFGSVLALMSFVLLFDQQAFAQPSSCPAVCVCQGIRCPAPPEGVDCSGCSTPGPVVTPPTIRITTPIADPGSGEGGGGSSRNNGEACAAAKHGLELPQVKLKDPTSYPGGLNPVDPIRFPKPGTGDQITEPACYACCAAATGLDGNLNMDCQDCCSDITKCRFYREVMN